MGQHHECLAKDSCWTRISWSVTSLAAHHGVVLKGVKLALVCTMCHRIWFLDSRSNFTASRYPIQYVHLKMAQQSGRLFLEAEHSRAYDSWRLTFLQFPFLGIHVYIVVGTAFSGLVASSPPRITAHTFCGTGVLRPGHAVLLDHGFTPSTARTSPRGRADHLNPPLTLDCQNDDE
ncbi:hypothetical protein Dimus_028981 [Dionaea muscipula]